MQPSENGFEEKLIGEAPWTAPVKYLHKPGPLESLWKHSKHSETLIKHFAHEQTT